MKSVVEITIGVFAGVLVFLVLISMMIYFGAEQPQTQNFIKNLKEMPADNVVKEINYSYGNYTVIAESGKIDGGEELFFHIKTDSSENGPRPGKPVFWKSKGKHGMRLIVVFSSPEEIKEFLWID